MSLPSSPTQLPAEVYNSPPSRRTRTVAIIKHHALDHRFDIEQRISEAGFEIVKERQMEFDIETDPDTMYDLFGEDYVCFAEGPVWVYVLERRRAVEVWHTLMGDADPEFARQETSTSLRALYGTSREQNAVMGAPDEQTAEIQIQAIFASSPPFPVADLPDVGSNGYPQSPQEYSENGTQLVTSGSMRSRSSSGANGSGNGDKPHFKARALPVTHIQPDIVPRMSRAAALRAGIKDTSTQPKRHPATKESIAKTFANVPGHKRTETISVASTAPPTIAPRMTRAASLRLGQPVPPASVKPKAKEVVKAKSPEAKTPAATFEGVPGHKRRETITVASIKPPTVAPRTNRSATLRVKKEAAPPSSFNLRAGTGTISRSSSRASLDLPGNSRPTFTRPASATSVRPSISSRPSSSIGSKPLKGSTEVNKQANGDSAAEAPAKPKPRTSVAAPPTIAPRTNRSALLRAAKMGTAAVTNAVKAPIKKATVKA